MNAPPDHDKFRAYRARKKAAGLREFRRWAPDIDDPEFRQQLADQITRINTAESERDMLTLGDRLAAEAWAELD